MLNVILLQGGEDMRRCCHKIILISLAVVALMNIATPSFAQDPGKKLGRGVVNILTGWVELPKNMYETSQQSNAFVGATIGFIKWLGMTVVRTGAGVYDAATFPFPLPKKFKPVLEPEYVMDKGKSGESK